MPIDYDRTTVTALPGISDAIRIAPSTIRGSLSRNICLIRLSCPLDAFNVSTTLLVSPIRHATA